MMMTAIACKEAGLNFAGLLLFVNHLLPLKCAKYQLLCVLTSVIAGVHDSYWTHACDVDKMNIILREKFVELYEAPILENVSIPSLFPCQTLVVYLQTNIFSFLLCTQGVFDVLLPWDCFVTFLLFFSLATIYYN